LFHQVEQPLGTGSPVLRRGLRYRLLGQRDGFASRFFRLLGLLFRLVDFDQRGPAPGGVVQRLCACRRLGVVGGVFFVNLRLLHRAFRAALPVAAELVVNQVESGQVGPLGPGKFLDDLFHVLFFHAFAQERLPLPGRRTRCHVRFLQLPADIGGAIHGLARQRRGGEIIGDAVVESHRVLGSAVASVAAAGLVLGIDGLAKQYLVSVRSGG